MGRQYSPIPSNSRSASNTDQPCVANWTGPGARKIERRSAKCLAQKFQLPPPKSKPTPHSHTSYLRTEPYPAPPTRLQFTPSTAPPPPPPLRLGSPAVALQATCRRPPISGYFRRSAHEPLPLRDRWPRVPPCGPVPARFVGLLTSFQGRGASTDTIRCSEFTPSPPTRSWRRGVPPCGSALGRPAYELPIDARFVGLLVKSQRWLPAPPAPENFYLQVNLFLSHIHGSTSSLFITICIWLMAPCRV
jgi:hypothetical protein